jgi:general secretion pathway protein M
VVFSRSTDENGNAASGGPASQAASQPAAPPTAQDAERAAATFTSYDLDVHLHPAARHIAVRAIMTVRNAAQQHRRLDAQLQRMQILQAQVPALHQRPQVNTADAARALDQSVRQLLGVSAQLQITGAQATVSIENLRADTLAQWLTQARLNAYATVTQAQLKRNAAASPATWSGKLTLGLPER